MTTWPDEGGDSELDVLDPTAGIGGLEEADPTAPPAAADDATGPTGATVSEDWAVGDVPEGSTEHDFFDVVRIWLTPDERRLAKIRITNRWRERLRKGPPLANVLTGAFRLHQKRTGGRHTLQFAPGAQQTNERIDQAFLDNWFSTLLETRDRIARLDSDPDASRAAQGRWIGEPTVGRNRSGTVEVTLGRGALTQRVSLDQDWLKTTRVSEICDAVQQAHDAAYENFVEPQYEPGEYDQIVDRLSGFQSEVLGRVQNHAGGNR